MRRNPTIGVLALAAALTVTACARHDTARTVPPTGIAPGTPTPARPVSNLPPCGDIASASTPPDCVLQSRDSAGLAFEVRHLHGGLTITVLDRTGNPIQTLTEPDTWTPAEPHLRDLDSNGRDELIIPVYGATSNIRYIIYHATGDATRFQRAGELSGIGIDTSTTGYVAVTAHDGYAFWNVGFWIFDADLLKPIVTAHVELLDDGTGKVSGSKCTVTDDGGLGRTGLDPDQARTQFCAEPAVARVMR